MDRLTLIKQIAAKVKANPQPVEIPASVLFEAVKVNLGGK